MKPNRRQFLAALAAVQLAAALPASMPNVVWTTVVSADGDGGFLVTQEVAEWLLANPGDSERGELTRLGF